MFGKLITRYGYRARWTTTYVNTLHCEILSSYEQTPNWHLRHDRGLSKGDCRSNMRHLIQILVVCLFALRLPNYKMKMGSTDFVLVGEYWEVFKAIRLLIHVANMYSSAYETTQALQSQDQRGLLECAHLLIVAS
nr:hypothetical protein CFP56_18582 [Quercus suber]